HDIFPLINQGEAFGLGRIGNIKEPMTLQAFTEHVKTRLHVKDVRVVGDLNKKINKVAILGGSGEKYIHQAKQMGADAYITGDMTLHPAQEAEEMGLAVIDPGHYIEKVMKQATANYLNKQFSKRLNIVVSQSNT